MSSWDQEEIVFEMSARSQPHDILGMRSRASYAELHAHYLAALDAILGPRRVDAWLDLGCSNMQLTGSLRPRAARVVGVDASAVALRIAKERYPDIESYQRCLPDLSGITGPFQVASGFGVLYYLRPDELAQCLYVVRQLLDSQEGLLLVEAGGPAFDEIARNAGFVRVGQQTWMSPRHTFDFLFFRFEQRIRQVEAILSAAAEEHGLDRCRQLHYHDRIVDSVSRHPRLWRGLVNVLGPLRWLARAAYGSRTLYRLLGLCGVRQNGLEVWRVTEGRN